MPESDLRETVARHDEQLKDHDRVLTDLRDHLRELVAEFKGFQTKVLVAAALFLAGSPTGDHMLRVIGLG